MIKQKTIIEVKIGDRIYELSCNGDSPLGELHDALMQMKGFCVERMVQAQKEEQEAADKHMEQSQQEPC